MELASWAADVAEQELSSFGARWQHVQAVARRAEGPVTGLDASDGDLLMAAAWLHDIGYGPAAADTGFHPLDGARWLAEQGQDDVAALVAHHSASDEEAELRALGPQLSAFPAGQPLLTAALTYCDLTTGPGGEPVEPDARLAEVEIRYGPDHVVPRSLRLAWPRLTAQLRLVEDELLAPARQAAAGDVGSAPTRSRGR